MKHPFFTVWMEFKKSIKVLMQPKNTRRGRSLLLHSFSDSRQISRVVRGMLGRASWSRVSPTNVSTGEFQRYDCFLYSGAVPSQKQDSVLTFGPNQKLHQPRQPIICHSCKLRDGARLGSFLNVRRRRAPTSCRSKNADGGVNASAGVSVLRRKGGGQWSNVLDWKLLFSFLWLRRACVCVCVRATVRAANEFGELSPLYDSCNRPKDSCYYILQRGNTPTPECGFH